MTDYERYGDYQASDRSSAGLFVAALLIGLGAGALLGLLFAPKTGRQMRRTLRRKYEDAREVMEDWGDQASDVIEKGAEWANYAKEKVGPIRRVIVNKVK